MAHKQQKIDAKLVDEPLSPGSTDGIDLGRSFWGSEKGTGGADDGCGDGGTSGRRGRVTGRQLPRSARRLEEFDHGPWGEKYPAIANAWRRNWQQVIRFFAFAPAVRKAVRGRGHFPSDKAATKLIYLVLQNVEAI